MEQNFHLSEDQLEQYAQGRLNPSQAVPLEEHLLICVACQEKLDSVENFALGMREALGNDPQLAGAAAPTVGWLDWLRRPVVSMSLGFATLILVVGIFSNGRSAIAPTASLVLTAVRGEMPQTTIARQYELTLADSPKEGGPFRVEVVTASGAAVWGSLAVSGPNGIQVTEPRRLDQGDYFVRLSSPDGKVLREYGFRVRP